MTKTIKVTRKHISKGVACNNGVCPIALAIKDQLKTGCHVGYYGIKLLQPGETVKYDHMGNIENAYPTNDKIKAFIDAYDLGKHVRGFTFKLEI